MQPSTSILDIFDFKFEKYVTPLIIRLTWILVLILAAGWISLISIAMLVALLPEGSASPPSRPTGIPLGPEPPTGLDTPDWLEPRVIAVSFWISSCIGVVLAVLWARVILECTIVIFKIAKSLAAIQNNLAGDD